MYHPADSLSFLVFQIPVFLAQRFFLTGQGGGDGIRAGGGGSLGGGVGLQGGVQIAGELQKELHVRDLVLNLVQVDFLGLLAGALTGGGGVDTVQGCDDSGERGLTEFLLAEHGGLGNITGPFGTQGLNHKFLGICRQAEFRRNQVTAD